MNKLELVSSHLKQDDSMNRMINLFIEKNDEAKSGMKKKRTCSDLASNTYKEEPKMDNS